MEKKDDLAGDDLAGDDLEELCLSDLPMSDKNKKDLDYMAYMALNGSYTHLGAMDRASAREKLYIVEQLYQYDTIESKAIASKYSDTKEKYIDKCLSLDPEEKSHIILNNIGSCYWSESVEKSLYYYKKSAKMGNLMAIQNLGVHYHDKNIPKALELYQYCVDSGYHRPLPFIGILCETPGPNYDKERAIDVYIHAYYEYDTFEWKEYTSRIIFEKLCDLGKIKNKEEYRAILNNGRLQYNLHVKTEQNLWLLARNVKDLEQELYTPGNIGAKAVSADFAEKISHALPSRTADGGISTFREKIPAEIGSLDD